MIIGIKKSDHFPVKLFPMIDHWKKVPVIRVIISLPKQFPMIDHLPAKLIQMSDHLPTKMMSMDELSLTVRVRPCSFSLY